MASGQLSRLMPPNTVELAAGLGRICTGWARCRCSADFVKGWLCAPDLIDFATGRLGIVEPAFDKG